MHFQIVMVYYVEKIYALLIKNKKYADSIFSGTPFMWMVYQVGNHYMDGILNIESYMDGILHRKRKHMYRLYARSKHLLMV